MVSSRFATDPARLEALFRDQVSLGQLAELGERLQRDSAGLIERAASGGEEVPSASIAAEVSFADEAARNAFMAELVESLKTLLTRHGSVRGERFRIALAAYPQLEDE